MPAAALPDHAADGTTTDTLRTRPRASADDRPAAPLAAVPRPRRPRLVDDLPLGSLTQREHRAPGQCTECGSTRLTRLTMNLSDGGTVDFVSCHHCEHRRWEEAGTVVPVETVLSRTSRR